MGWTPPSGNPASSPAVRSGWELPGQHPLRSVGVLQSCRPGLAVARLRNLCAGRVRGDGSHNAKDSVPRGARDCHLHFAARCGRGGRPEDALPGQVGLEDEQRCSALGRKTAVPTPSRGAVDGEAPRRDDTGAAKSVQAGEAKQPARQARRRRGWLVPMARSRGCGLRFRLAIANYDSLSGKNRKAL